jgi:hypothetical protein
VIELRDVKIRISVDWGQSRVVKEGDNGRGKFAHVKRRAKPSKIGKTNKEVTRTGICLEASIPINQTSGDETVMGVDKGT